jgi:hypothetical protein
MLQLVCRNPLSSNHQIIYGLKPLEQASSGILKYRVPEYRKIAVTIFAMTDFRAFLIPVNSFCCLAERTSQNTSVADVKKIIDGGSLVRKH